MNWKAEWATARTLWWCGLFILLTPASLLCVGVSKFILTPIEDFVLVGLRTCAVRGKRANREAVRLRGLQ